MLEDFNVSLFNVVRKIRVYLPVGYETSSNRYPVLYMHDGQNVFNDKEAIGGVSLGLFNYMERGKINLIVVAIDQNTTGEERINEYCPWVCG